MKITFNQNEIGEMLIHKILKMMGITGKININAQITFITTKEQIEASVEILKIEEVNDGKGD
jgi:hypothetical protein